MAIDFTTTLHTTTLREQVYRAIYTADDAVSMDDLKMAIDYPHKWGELGRITHQLCNEGIITEVPRTDPIAFVPVIRDPARLDWAATTLRMHITG